MATEGTASSGHSLAWIVWLLIVALIGWQLYLGATIQEVGIPGVFTVKFGRKEPPPPPPARMSATEPGIDRYGSDYKDFLANDIQECLRECAADTRCKAISFNRSSRQCWMKNAFAQRKDNAGFISAVKVGD